MSEGPVEEEFLAVPHCPNGLMIFPPGTVKVEDADEEILELYMDLASTKDGDDSSRGTGGLGFLDSSSSFLELELILTPKKELLEVSNDKGLRGSTSAKSKKGVKKDAAKEEVRLNVQIQQDLMALKGRKGDTVYYGAVADRSLHLAKNLLTQHHFPILHPLFNPVSLAKARILELGAGTGLLAVLLSRLCSGYTASDRLENLKLVSRNLELNDLNTTSPSGLGSPKKTTKKVALSSDQTHHIQLEEIDWVAVSQNKRREASGSPIARQRRLEEEGYDLVLAVDCIYNENLVKPLVDTLSEYCRPGGRTIVWVVVELRSSDVLTLFIDTWLHDGVDYPWTVVRLPSECMGDWDGTRSRWVGWVGWR